MENVLSRDVSQQLLGIVGCIHVARFGWLYLEMMARVLRAPHDAQPSFAFACVYLAVALIALVPAFGLVAHRPLGRTWWVSAFAIDGVITVALVI